jgi:polysaccharide pyruvyl transferase WcaK-like protein
MQEVPLNLEITNFDILDFNRQTQHLVAEEINKLNPDLIIVGGGGTIDGHKSRVHTGTAFQMTMPEIEKLNAPLAFWGLGHNLFRGQKQYNMDMFEDFVLYCKSNGFPFSVRRDKSKDRLSEVLSADALDYIQEVPDPGFFVPAEGAPYCLSPDTTRNNTILQIALDSTKHRFGNDEDVLDNFVLSVMDIILYLIDQHNSDVILALHTILDAQGTNMLRAYFDDHTARNKARMHTRILGTAHPIFANLFFANYMNADMVIGMRGHSVICGTGLGVPTIALSTHDKVTGYMDEIGCSEWTLELGFDYDELVAKVDGIMNVEDAVRQRAIVMEATEDWATESRDFAYQCFNRAV